MNLDVSKLFRKKVKTLPFKSTFELSTIEREELKIFLSSILSIEGKAYYDGEVVTLVGTINTTLRMQCSRCLKEIDYPITIEFEDEFCKDGSIGEGYLISEEEEIDLTNMIIDNIILSSPIKVNCKENCKGLCQKCGKNLNEGFCNCTSDDIDPRLEVLKNLFKGD